MTLDVAFFAAAIPAVLISAASKGGFAGGAAFAGADGPVPAEVARADFTRSLHWLLTGIAAA